MPEPAAPRRVATSLAMTALAALFAVLAVLAPAGPAGAQAVTDDPVQPTTTISDVGPVSECSPGHIVRRPDCGIPAESATDPGGWLQLSLFYLICGAIVLIVAGVWWRARQVRRRRRELGLDPVTLARSSDQFSRRSTRSEPVDETSSKSPESSAGR